MKSGARVDDRRPIPRRFFGVKTDDVIIGPCDAALPPAITSLTKKLAK
jgi:hypothetical protein